MPSEAASAVRLIGKSVGAVADPRRGRQRRHGRGVPRRARRRRLPPPRGAEGRATGSGLAADRRALPARARDAGGARPPQHRAPDGRRHDRGRPAVLRDGTGGRRADRSLLRRAPAVDRRAARSVPQGVRRRAVRAREPGRPPRHQARQHPGDQGRRAEAARLRRRQDPVARRRASGRPGGHRGDLDDDARLRQPRAGERAAQHHGHRRLLARRAAARAAHRRAAVHAHRHDAGRHREAAPRVHADPAE